MCADMSSFMSEHTAEFYLVPRLCDILRTRFSHVLPFFFWSTREGNSTAARTDMPDGFNVCALFARRPKIAGEQLAMTINREVHQTASALSMIDIPTFAGVPLVRSLWDMRHTNEIAWFHLQAAEAIGDSVAFSRPL